MKQAIVISLLFISTSAFSQYLWMNSKITCDTAQQKMVKEAVEKFKPILKDLVKEGYFLNWAYNNNIKKGKLVLTYTATTPSEAKFKAGFDLYLKRASEKYPELYPGYAKACPTRKDTLNLKSVSYPVIKGDLNSVAVGVEGVDAAPDPNQAYNIVVDFTAFANTNDDKIDSVGVNWGLAEIGRVFNLHVAAGVPREKINIVAAVHAYGQFTFLNNEAYQKKYKTDNPNLPMIKELTDAGVKFLVCGQSMTWMKVEKGSLIPEAKVTLTAKTTLTSYQAKGYTLIDIEN